MQRLVFPTVRFFVPIENTSQLITKLLMHSIHNFRCRRCTRIRWRVRMNGIPNHIQELLPKGYGQAPYTVEDDNTRADPRRQSIEQWYIPSMKHFGGTKTINGNHGNSMLLRQLQKAFADNGIFLIGVRSAFRISLKDFGNSTRYDADAVSIGQRFVDRRSRCITSK